MRPSDTDRTNPAIDPRDYVLDITSVPLAAPQPAEPAPPNGRPFLSVHFQCCGVYQRIYRTADGSAYAGHCPRCAKPVRLRIGPGGTSCRMFTVQ